MTDPTLEQEQPDLSPQTRTTTALIADLHTSLAGMLPAVPQEQIKPFSRALGNLLEGLLSAATTLALQASMTVAARQEVDHQEIERQKVILAETRELARDLSERVGVLEQRPTSPAVRAELDELRGLVTTLSERVARIAEHLDGLLGEEGQP